MFVSRLAVAVNMVLYVVAMLAFVFVPSAVVGAVGMFMLGGFMAGQGVAYAGVGEVLGPRADGKAFALFMVAMAGVSVAGPYVGGTLYTLEPGAAFVAAAALTLVFAGLLLRTGTGAHGAEGVSAGSGSSALPTTDR